MPYSNTKAEKSVEVVGEVPYISLWKVGLVLLAIGGACAVVGVKKS
jgi:hypothetical protein